MTSMRLREVLDGIVYEASDQFNLDALVAGLAYDSRQVAAGFLFFAFPGSKVDGRVFAEQALQKGACAVVSEGPPAPGFAGPWISVRHGRRALALAARNFYRAPDDAIGVTGTTGTNGKTTTTFLADALLQSTGARTGLIGTIEYHLAGKVLPSVNTTPESLDVYKLLQQLQEAGGRYLTMEVSSHALALGRAYGIHFHTAVFTNLTRDHLDFHQTMEDYFAAKQSLFNGENGAAPRWAAINVDDEYGRKLQVSRDTRTLRYGMSAAADVRAEQVEAGFHGLRFNVTYEGRTVHVESPLVGQINVYNLLAAYCVGISYGLEGEQIAAGLAQCKAVPGRFERVDEFQPFLVLVDYAHTDDALRNAIQAARSLGGKRLITLFGCGGDRDRTKRPLMGKAAAELSDYVVLTSDNPRSEEPLDIIMDALVGVRRFDTPHITEPDRETAIRRAIEQAEPGDIVLIAGKGHEPYQIIKGKSFPFDDREIARKILRGFGYGRRSS